VPRVAAVVAALAAFLWQASLYPAVPNSDDAYISYRYAENLARGAGPVFNPGERVEGYTDLLWVALLAGLHRLGADTPRTAYLLSVALGALCIVLASLWPSRLAPVLQSSALGGPGDAPWCTRRGLALWGGAAALVLGCSHALAFHAVQGLETTLMAAAVSGALMALEPGSGRPGWASAALFLLAMLTRPEALLVFLVAVGVFAVRRAPAGARILSRELAPAAGTLAAYAGFLAWRLAYYGALVPNTYFAKRAALGADFASGAAYVGEWLTRGSGAVLVAACAVIALALGRHVLATWPFVLLAVHAVAVVTTGGDHFPLGRFFVPLAPLAAALAGLAVALVPAAARRLAPAWARGAVVGVVQGAALAGAVAALAVPGVLGSRVADTIYTRFTGKWVHLGKVLRGTVPQGTTIALSPVGAIPYFSGLPTVDILGLTDAHIARAAADPAIARKGHQKHDGAYVLSRAPGLLILGNGMIVSRDGAQPGDLWWFPDAGFGADGAAVRGRRVDLRAEGGALAYEADIESNPAFARLYRPALIPLEGGLELLVWRRAAAPR